MVFKEHFIKKKIQIKQKKTSLYKQKGKKFYLQLNSALQ